MLRGARPPPGSQGSPIRAEGGARVVRPASRAMLVRVRQDSASVCAERALSLHAAHLYNPAALRAHASHSCTGGGSCSAACRQQTHAPAVWSHQARDAHSLGAPSESARLGSEPHSLRARSACAVNKRSTTAAFNGRRAVALNGFLQSRSQAAASAPALVWTAPESRRDDARAGRPLQRCSTVLPAPSTR